LEAAGADFIVIATNTNAPCPGSSAGQPPHSRAQPARRRCEAILAKGFKTVGLLGTRFTMEKNLYQDALARKGITVLIPMPTTVRW